MQLLCGCLLQDSVRQRRAGQLRQRAAAMNGHSAAPAATLQNGSSGEGAHAALDSSTDADSSGSEDGDGRRQGGRSAGGDVAADGVEAQPPLPLVDARMRLQVMGILWANWEVSTSIFLP